MSKRYDNAYVSAMSIEEDGGFFEITFFHKFREGPLIVKEPETIRLKPEQCVDLMKDDCPTCGRMFDVLGCRGTVYIIAREPELQAKFIANWNKS